MFLDFIRKMRPADRVFNSLANETRNETGPKHDIEQPDREDRKNSQRCVSGDYCAKRLRGRQEKKDRCLWD